MAGYKLIAALLLWVGLGPANRVSTGGVFIPGSGVSNPIVASCTLRCAERVPGTCTAPAWVSVDCVGGGDSGNIETAYSDANVRVFHDLDYVIDYGDSACSSGQGNWEFGTPNYSKNIEYSPIGGHVYECAGTFTVTTTVTDSAGNVDTTTDSITIEAEDTGWPDADTICVCNDGAGAGCVTLGVAGFTGCPHDNDGDGDCTSVGETAAACIESADYDASLQTGAGKRTKYRCGDAFTASADPALTNAENDGSLVGGYGSNCDTNPPAVTITSGSVHSGSANISGWRVIDMQYIGDNNDSTSAWSSYSAAADNGLLLRVDLDSMGHCSQYGTLSNNETGTILSAIVDSTCDSTGCASSQHWAMNEVVMKYGGFVGNHYHLDGVDSNALRAMGQQWTIFAHNKFSAATTNGISRLTLQFRSCLTACTTRDQQFWVFSDNEIYDDGDEGGRTLFLSSTGNLGAGGIPARTHDAILQRNQIAYGPTVPNRFIQHGIDIDGHESITVRNNLIDFRGTARPTTGAYRCLSSPINTAIGNELDFYNNTCINDETGGSTMNLCDNAGATNNRCRNNIAWEEDKTTGLFTTNGSFTAATNNLIWYNGTQGCPWGGCVGDEALSAPSETFDFTELQLRSSGIPAGIKDSGLTFPDTSAANRRPYVYRDGFLGRRGTLTGGPDNLWDIGAHESGSTP